MPVEVQQIEVVSAPPDIWNWTGQVPQVPKEGNYGLCDPNASDLRQGAEPWRYATVVFEFTRTGALWTLTASQSIEVLGKGDGQSNDALTGVNLSGTDTDLNKDGGMTKGYYNVYVIQALGMQFVQPYAASDTDPAAKQYLASIDNLSPRLQKAMLDNVFLEMDYEDEDCPRTMGLAKFWPQHAASHGNEIVFNGASLGPSQVMPMRRPFMSGSAKGDWSAKMKAKTGPAFQVEDDPAFPVETTVETILVPLQALFYGRPSCAQRCMPACLTGDGKILVAPPTLPAGFMPMTMRP